MISNMKIKKQQESLIKFKIMNIPQKSNNKFIAVGFMAVAFMIPIAMNMSQETFTVNDLSRELSKENHSSELVDAIKKNPEILKVSMKTEPSTLDGINVVIEEKQGFIVGQMLDPKAKGASFIMDGKSNLILDGDKNVIHFTGENGDLSKDVLAKIEKIREKSQVYSSDKTIVKKI